MTEYLDIKNVVLPVFFSSESHYTIPVFSSENCCLLSEFFFLLLPGGHALSKYVHLIDQIWTREYFLFYSENAMGLHP